MSHEWRLALWLGLLALLILAFVLLRGILLPFLVGMALAYLLDPAADRLQRWGLGRTVATLVIIVSFTLVFLAVLVLVLPPLTVQATELASNLPGYLERLRASVMPWVSNVVARTELAGGVSTEGLMERLSGRALEFLGAALSGVLQSGLAFLNLVSLIFVTPVVAFYLIRDWDRMVAKLRAMVPPDDLPTAERLAREVDGALAGALRGHGPHWKDPRQEHAWCRHLAKAGR